MEKRLLVLYRNEKLEQSWAIYSTGEEEANLETELKAKKEPGLIEVSRIWISTSARLEWFDE